MLAVSDLIKTFESGGPAVIHNLNMQIEPGEFAVIMGSSGSGKSSLLYLLSGLDRANAGTIKLQGENLADLDETQLALLRRKQVGFVFQDFNLVGHLSLLENILIAGKLNGGKQIAHRAKELLRLVGIADLADRLPSQVSGGEQQRAAVARALINEPAVLLADEPTGNLSSAVSNDVLDLFERIHQNGQTIVMVTHELKAACRGERVLFMRDGNIPEDFTFTPDTPMEEREIVLFQWLSQRGW